MKKKKTVKKLTGSERAMRSKELKIKAGWVQKSFMLPHSACAQLKAVAAILPDTTERQVLVRAIDLLFNSVR